MKVLYLECAMGASGDMLMGALAGLLEHPGAFAEEMNALRLPGVAVRMEPSVKCGITGVRISVRVHGGEEGEDAHAHHREHAHHHTGLGDIERVIGALPVSESVRENALAVYRLIAEAESEAHGRPVDEVHFHEVGALDAVADVTGVSLLMERLCPDKVVVSPVNTGFGRVRCAHGILPVPAPATAHILRGAPIYGGEIEGELCTPTGAALLRHFATEFSAMPVMTVAKVSCGMGKKDFAMANCVRAFWGETRDALPRIAELRCNLDDMTPEAIGYAAGVLFENGALDVFTAAIQMKKSRPGVLLACLCHEPDAERFARLLLEHTTTIGVRKTVCERYAMDSQTEMMETRYGSIRVKRSRGFGLEKRKPEYDDVARLAKRLNIPFGGIAGAANSEGGAEKP